MQILVLTRDKAMEAVARQNMEPLKGKGHSFTYLQRPPDRITQQVILTNGVFEEGAGPTVEAIYRQYVMSLKPYVGLSAKDQGVESALLNDIHGKFPGDIERDSLERVLKRTHVVLDTGSLGPRIEEVLALYKADTDLARSYHSLKATLGQQPRVAAYGLSLFQALGPNQLCIVVEDWDPRGTTPINQLLQQDPSASIISRVLPMFSGLLACIPLFASKKMTTGEFLDGGSTGNFTHCIRPERFLTGPTDWQRGWTTAAMIVSNKITQVFGGQR